MLYSNTLKTKLDNVILFAFNCHMYCKKNRLIYFKKKFTIFLFLSLFLKLQFPFGVIFCQPSNFFSFSSKVCLLAINSFSFPLFENAFIIHLLLKGILTEYRNLGCHFFSLSTLKVFFYCLLVSVMAGEKSTVTQILISIYVMFNFSLAAFSDFLKLILVPEI